MTVAEKIKAYRKEKGMTQKQLADACGMHDSAIRRYESGRQNPKFETLQRIADAFGINVLDLYEPKILNGIGAVTAAAINDLGYFETEENPTADERKTRLNKNFDSVNDEGKNKILEYSDDIATNEKYRSDAPE